MTRTRPPGPRTRRRAAAQLGGATGSPALRRAGEQPARRTSGAPPGRRAGGAPDVEYRPRDDGRPDPGEIVLGLGRPTTRATGAARTGRCSSSAAGTATCSACCCRSQDHDRDAADEARHGRFWTDIGTGAWDSPGPAERGAARPAAGAGPGRGPPGGRGAGPRPVRPGGRRGAARAGLVNPGLSRRRTRPARAGAPVAAGCRRPPAR